jgi:hypothetical protein
LRNVTVTGWEGLRQLEKRDADSRIPAITRCRRR